MTGLLPLLAAAALLLGGVHRPLLVRLGGADRLEPNDSLAAASAVRLGRHDGLSSPPGDVDWFRVTIPAGRALEVEASPPPDLGGEVTAHDATGAVLAKASYGAPFVYLPPDLGAREVLVRVWGARRQPYQLRLDAVGPGTRFEPNDTQELATALSPGRTAALRGNGNDWYSVDVPARRALRVALVDADPSLALRCTTTPADGALAGQGARALARPAGALPARVWVQVTGTGSYELDVELGPLEPRPEERLPVFPGDLEPNDRRENAAAIVPGVYPDLAADDDDDGDWYRVTPPPGHAVVVSVEYDATLSHLALELTEPDAPPAALVKKGAWTEGRRVETGLRSLYYRPGMTEVLVRVTGSARAYRLVLRTSPGGPGLPLAPGHYPGYAGTGFDVFSVALRTGERLTARVALPAEAGGDPYAFLALNLRDGDVSSYARPSDGQRLELSSEPAAKDHEVYLVVAGEARPFDLTLELSGRRARDEEPFVPPRARATGPGIYPDRALRKEGFYALALGADQQLTAAVRFDPNAGDLDLELLDPKGSRLAAATGTDAREQLTFVSPTAQRVYLRVFTYSAATVRYTLELALDGDTAPVEAPVLPPGSHAGLRCAGDARHALRLGAGDLVRLALFAAAPPGAAPPDLDLALHDPSGLELARATALGAQETLEHRASTAGLYTVRVHGAEAEYTLSVELEPR